MLFVNGKRLQVLHVGFCKSTKLINYHEYNFYIPMLGFVGGDQQHNKEEVVVLQLHAGGGAFSLLETRGLSGGLYDKPLLCFGCGIGWFSFLMGFVFPPLWYYATILYCGNYYQKDPRERPGLAASAIAALICTVAVIIFLLAMHFC